MPVAGADCRGGALVAHAASRIAASEIVLILALIISCSKKKKTSGKLVLVYGISGQRT
jgi:hypothetical protein